MSGSCNRLDCIIPHNQKQCFVTMFAYVSSMIISWFDYTYFRKHSFWFLFQIIFCFIMILFTWIGYMYYTNRKCSMFHSSCVIGSRTWWMFITITKIINFGMVMSSDKANSSHSSYQVWLFVMCLNFIDIFISILNVTYTSRMHELNQFNYRRS